MATFTGPGKVTQFFRSGKQGWTESYYCQLSGCTTPLFGLFDYAALINNRRRKALDINNVLDGVRCEAYIFPGNTFGPSRTLSDVTESAAYGCGDGLASGTGAAIPNLGWLIGLFSAGDEYHDRRIYRGWTRDDMDTYVVNGKPVTPARLTTLVADLAQVLGPPAYIVSSASGGGTIQAAMLTTTPPPPNPYTVTQVTLDAQGRLVLTFQAPTSVVNPYTVGQQVIVKVNRQRCARGVSGRAYIYALAGAQPTYSMTLNKMYHCDPGSLFNTFGTVRIYTPQFTPIQGAVNEQAQRTKNTGRAFFTTRGRQRSKC